MLDRFAQQKDWYFESEVQTEAVNRLLYVVENGELFSLLDGRYGTGRSTVLQQTATELVRCGRRVVHLNAAALDCRSTLWHLCGALSIFTPADAQLAELMTLIRDELMARAHCEHQTVVLLDDVDLAQEDVSSVLHLLMSLAETSDGRIHVIAVAEQPIGFSLQKRSALNVSLQPLREREAIEFAVRRLTCLNCEVASINETGWRAIADLGQGLPGQLLRICQIVQVVASMQSGPIDAALVHNAADELLPQAA